MLFVVIVLEMNKHPAIQIHCQLLLSMGMACFLLHTRPFEIELINNLEIFNEICTVAILIEMTLFCDGYPLKVKIGAGWAYLSSIGFIIVVQLFFLLREMRRDFKICKNPLFYLF